MEEIAQQLKTSINKLLTVGDWKSSAFLQLAEKKLREFEGESDRLIKVLSTDPNKSGTVVKHEDIIVSRAVGDGYIQVFILLYQVESNDLKKWYHDVEMLTQQCSTRPVYLEESFAQECIRSKTNGIERNGYAVVNVKKNDFYKQEIQAVDILGHNLVNLKENSVKLENIVEFIIANKQHYVIRNNELVSFGRIGG
ncbi:MAG: IcmQ [uncultured bacterium]|nr:MAG: IcmQ [uncultured bacterium]